MKRLTLRILGPFAASCDGRIVPMSEAPKRLLGFLAVNPGTWRRGYVAGQLWPEVPEGRALGNLRNAVWRLGNQMNDAVIRNNDHLGLGESVVTDLERAKSLIRNVLDGDATVLEAASECIRVFGGELLPDWYEDWLLFERARLRQQSLHALERLAVLLAEQRRWAEALDAALTAVALEPLRETAHRTAFAIHMAEGNAAEARRQFEEYRTLLHDELHTAPSAQFAAEAAPLVTRPRSSRAPRDSLTGRSRLLRPLRATV